MRHFHNIAVCSVITSSPDLNDLGYEQNIEMLAYCMKDITFTKEQLEKLHDEEISDAEKNKIFDEHKFGDDKYANESVSHVDGDLFDTWLDTVVKTRVDMIYVDDLSFYALFLILKFKARGYVIDNNFRGVSTQGRLKIFNKDDTYYTIRFKPANTNFTVELRDIFQMTRERGFKLIDVDYTKLTRAYDNYCLNLATAICLKFDSIIARLYFTDERHDSITIGQYSYNKLRKYIPNMDTLFPKLDINFTEGSSYGLREGYRGGIVYCNPKYKGKEVHGIKAYDCNKMYSSMMYGHDYPRGYPVEIESLDEIDCDLEYSTEISEYRLNNKNNNLFIIQLHIESALLKPKHIPWVDFKDTSNLSTPSEGGGRNNANCTELFDTTLTLTNVSFELLLESYQFTDPSYLQIRHIWYFSKCQPFNNFIEDKYKEACKAPKGSVRYRVCKLILETAYGKFGTKPITRNTVWEQKDDEMTTSDVEIPIANAKSAYLPVAMFITDYARAFMIRIANKNFDNVIYMDTDSLHIINNAPVVGITIGKGLGQFKIEHEAIFGLYVSPKVYVLGNEHRDIELKASGYNQQGIKTTLSLDDIEKGAVVENVRKHKTSSGYAYAVGSYQINNQD